MCFSIALLFSSPGQLISFVIVDSAETSSLPSILFHCKCCRGRHSSSRESLRLKTHFSRCNMTSAPSTAVIDQVCVLNDERLHSALIDCANVFTGSSLLKESTPKSIPLFVKHLSNFNLTKRTSVQYSRERNVAILSQLKVIAVDSNKVLDTKEMITKITRRKSIHRK